MQSRRRTTRQTNPAALLRLLLLTLVAALPLVVAPGAAHAAVTLTTMSPQEGPVFGGNLVTVTGTGLDAITAVRNSTTGSYGVIKTKSATSLTFEAPVKQPKKVKK